MTFLTDSYGNAALIMDADELRAFRELVQLARRGAEQRLEFREMELVRLFQDAAPEHIHE